jgi:hypothetical protein
VDESQRQQYISDLLTGTDEEDNWAPSAVLARDLQKGKEMRVANDDFIIITVTEKTTPLPPYWQ